MNSEDKLCDAVVESVRELGPVGKSVKARLPKCPYCKVQLRPVAFKGYYDEFDCWECDCRDIPGAVEQRGGYA